MENKAVAHTRQSLTSNAHLLQSTASKHAVYGALIAVAAIVAATLLVSYLQSGGVSLQGIVDAQSSNPSLWLLDSMPFLFAFWGQHVSSIIAYEAGAMVVDQTNELRAQTTALENQARHGATHDTLTGLPNQALVYDRIECALNIAQAEKKPLAILFLDLNQFNEINHTLGHYNGDLLLKQVAARLRVVVQEPDSVAHLRGDKFAILLPKMIGAEDAIEAARKVHKSLEAPFTLEGLILDIQSSIGIALFPEHGGDADTLLQHADVAMYVAAKDNRSYIVYDPKLDQYSPHRLTLMGELHQAIAHDELILDYQPKIELGSGSVVEVEALVRWNHPRHGRMQPNDFIPLAERTGLIKSLTVWVIKHALQQCQAWRRTGIELAVSVNLSAQDLLDMELVDTIAGLLAYHEVAPCKLVLEITESAIMVDHERALQLLLRLAQMGVRLSIDDFGTGYSSLSYLSKLPVNEIKIDKSFILNMTESEADAKIVRATIELAHNLGLKVTAEGIENKDVLSRLEKLGCDALQGYYISHPLNVVELTAWLNKSNWRLNRA